jgi:hypothetical protein
MDANNLFTVHKKQPIGPMKTIQMITKSEAKRNLSLPPELTHTPEELANLHRAIHFTHKFLHNESMQRMDLRDVL